MIDKYQIDYYQTKGWKSKDRKFEIPGWETKLPKVDLSLNKEILLRYLKDNWTNLTNLPIRFRPGWGSYRWQYSPKIPQLAVELGASLIDTAEGYGFGKVETELGKALENVSLGDTILASKVSRNHLSSKALYSAALRSRDKLKRTIDLYQIHWYDPKYRWEDIFETLAKLLEEKVIHYVGVCNCSVQMLAEAREAAYTQGIEIVSNQVAYNLEVLPYRSLLKEYCDGANIHLIGHSPLGQKKPNVNQKLPFREFLDSGVVPIPGTNSLDHLRTNMQK